MSIPKAVAEQVIDDWCSWLTHKQGMVCGFSEDGKAKMIELIHKVHIAEIELLRVAIQAFKDTRDAYGKYFAECEGGPLSETIPEMTKLHSEMTRAEYAMYEALEGGDDDS